MLNVKGLTIVMTMAQRISELEPASEPRESPVTVSERKDEGGAAPRRAPPPPEAAEEEHLPR